MSTQRIPNNEKQIIQSNQGDYQGNLWATFNVDLESSPGVIKVAPKLEKAVGTVTWGSDDIVQAINLYKDKYYIVTTKDIFSCSANNNPTVEGNWAAINHVGSFDVGLESDATSFAGLLVISGDVDVLSWDGTTLDVDWWTTVSKGGETGSALTANYPHTMEVLRTGVDTLFVTDVNTVKYANLTAGHTTVTLDTLMVANTLTPSLDRMWAGTYTEVEENAFVYELQVGSDIALSAYMVDGRACLSMFTYKNTPFVITERGNVQMFNGAGFETVARFPFALESKVMTGARPGVVQDSPTSMAIHPKGARVSGDYAFIYVDMDDEYNGGTNLDNRSFSGVWVLNLKTYSLTHRGALSNSSKVIRSGPVFITNTPQTRLMIGAETSDGKGVWMETTPDRAFFITTRHESESVMDAFETAVVKADTLDTGETITVKYKDAELPDFPFLVDDITWLNSIQFTTTAAITSAMVDYEIFILAGHQAGKSCHIVNVEGTTTKTVTVDASLGTLNQTSDIQIENWKKVVPTVVANDPESVKIGANNVTPFRQYKVEMIGDITVREFISKSNAKNEL